MIMKKSWKDRKGVSPVIATILMVAITVVLAAVLYVMVMGFGGDSNTTPAGQITKVESMGEVDIGTEGTPNKVNTYKLTLSAFSPDAKFSDLKVSVEGTQVTLAEYVSGAKASYYVDLGGDGLVSQGDYIVIFDDKDSTFAGEVVSILHIPSGGMIAEKTLPA